MPGYVDDFNDLTLNGRWSWVRMDSQFWSLTERHDFLRLRTNPGGLMGDGNSAANILLQPAPAGDYLLETHLFFVPNQNFQVAGLVVYMDDDNYLMFGRAFCQESEFCLGDGLYYDLETAGTWSSENFATQILPAASDIFLRLVRKGNTYTAFYSYTGDEWTEVGAHTVDPGVGLTRVGLGAWDSYQGVEPLPADFDYFRVEELAPALGEFTCQDPLGCVTVGPGEPVHIAYALVVSGPDASLGIDSLRGIEIAVADRGGMLLGHPIELAGEDTGCTPEGGQAAAEKLVGNPNLLGVIGTSCSSEARVAAPILSAAGLTMISPSNTAPDLTDPAQHAPGYLRVAWNDNVQGVAVAEFAYNFLGARTAATIHDNSTYATQLQQVFAERFQELGGEITFQGAIQPTDTDMSAILTQVAANPPDLLYYPIFVTDGGQLTSQARSLPALNDTALMSSDALFSPDFLGAAGEASIGMYLSSPDFTVFGEGYQDFLAKYQARYAAPPISAFHAHAYDASMLLFAAIEKVAVIDEDGTLHIGRQELRNAIFATQGFPGLTGSLTCSRYGDCADPHIAIYQVAFADPARWNPGAAADSNPRRIYP